MTNKPLKTNKRLNKKLKQDLTNKQKTKERRQTNQIKKTQGYGRKNKRRGD